MKKEKKLFFPHFELEIVLCLCDKNYSPQSKNVENLWKKERKVQNVENLFL